MRFALIVACASLLIGCSRPAPTAAPDPEKGHDHAHDVATTKADVKMPATFDELVTRIDEYSNQIRTAIESGNPVSAHRALDELDIVIAETMTLAQGAVPEERLSSVNEARQTIHNAFLEIHQSIDANEKPDFSAKAEAIETAIATLKQSVQSLPAK